MRSGASSACNWAMRQLLSIFPPRIVSRKSTIQLSSGHTFPIAAAAPPSAMTVWALPRRDLQTIAVRRPRSLASMAALSPAPPAPMTITSKSWVSMSVIASEQLRVGEDTRRHEPHVEVGQRHEDQARPGDLHMAGVQRGEELPDAGPKWMRREAVDVPATKVPARV